MRVLVTGSRGLVGTELCAQLLAAGHEVSRYDIKDNGSKNVLLYDQVFEAVRGCEPDGVVHLAACSRVVWGEAFPWGCIEANVIGTRNVLRAAMEVSQRRQPWVLFTSSREVYGNAPFLPVREEVPVMPINVYGRTKAVGEDLVISARTHLRTAVVRLSNVYGSVDDHEDRAIPAFAIVAAKGGLINLSSPLKVFDFVHVEDAARGLVLTAKALHAGDDNIPRIHLTTGVGTQLGHVASLAFRMAGERGLNAKIERRESKRYEVEAFVGDTMRASSHLGWKAQISFEDGFRRLVNDFAGGK